MQLFYHHVGQTGATKDFPKTVYNKLPISLIQDNVPEETLSAYQILPRLKRAFPSGFFNCWGVPTGAKSVIRRLSMGDVVLLIEKAGRLDGEIPVLCEVKAFWPIELPQLSRALWGDVKYPYIFFFESEPISLTWPELRTQLNYSENFDPRGNFYAVRIDRLDGLDGVDRYIQFVRQNYGSNF